MTRTEKRQSALKDIETTIYYPNRDDWDESFWKHDYIVALTEQGIPFVVNADNEQDAVDYVIDDCQKNHPGLIMSREEEDEEEFLDEYISGGNEGLHLNTTYIHIQQIW